jgi:glucokinase
MSPSPSAPSVGLVGDLGGTNARFALAEIAAHGEPRIREPKALPAQDFADPQAAIDAYLAGADTPKLAFAALACAGPIEDGRVTMTNLAWTLDEAILREALKTDRVRLLNDLAAAAWAAPALGAEDLAPIGAHPPPKDGTIAVFGAGTGTNCAAYLSGDGREAVLAGEGGHIGFAPADETEVAILGQLAGRFGRVSLERLASGPGLLNIYEALCALAGRKARCDDPAAVADLAKAGDADAAAALDRLARVLGAAAGDFALIFNAAAVYLAGGMAGHVLTTEARKAAFRERFEDKGRFSARQARVGAFVITSPYVALLGAARAMGASAR